MTEVAVSQRAVSEPRLVGRLSSDERLAQLASRGSSRAFALLYERHHRALYGYCRSIVRNEEDAQDALQSAVMRALAALQGSERDIAVRPWLFRIVHNEAISLLRRRRHGDRPIDGQELAHGSLEHTVENRERLTLLVTDIQSLGERQRAALLMRELSGLSMEEIAAALSTSPGAAKQALFEARCALHELAEGRAMECDAVRQTLSERDGRVLRGRKIRAHLRACADCLQFRTLIETRGADLRALVPPLPAAGTVGLLAQHAVGAGGGHAGEAVLSTAAFGAPTAISLVAKGLAGVAIMTTATAGTAELVRHHGHPAVQPSERASDPGAPAAQLPGVRLRADGLDRSSAVAGAADPRLRRAIRPAPAAVTVGAASDPLPGTPVTADVGLPPTASAPTAGVPPAAPVAPQAVPSPGKSSEAPGHSSARKPHGQAGSTPPGQAKSGHVPQGQAKSDHVAPGQAKQGASAKPKHDAESNPQVQAPVETPPSPAPGTQPGPPSSPGHSQGAHGHGPHGGSDADPAGPAASHGHP